MLLFLAAALSLAGLAGGTAIANGVVGQPQVQCTESSVTFSVRTQNTFRGNIYIKSKYSSPSCRQEFFSNDYNGATYSVRIGECGMKRIRQLQPNGMNYVLVFVVNFHPQFVTKVDRAYNVRCFYAQVDKAVTAGLSVSMLTTQTIEDTTTLVPNCEYKVRKDSINGPEVRYAQVGDKLVHVWTCTDPRNSNFGMLVKNCFVDDGTGSTVRVLDTRGCPVFTPVIQSNLVYDNSQTQATAEIWAYKFPDRSNLYFRCQIQICNKRDNECLGVTPPNCPQTLKSEFEPNSQIVPGDPTRVVSSGGAFARPGFSNNRNGFRTVQPTDVVEGFENNRVGNVRTFPDSGGYGNDRGVNSYGSSQGYAQSGAQSGTNYQQSRAGVQQETLRPAARGDFVSSSNRLGSSRTQSGVASGLRRPPQLRPATLLQNDPDAADSGPAPSRTKRRKPSEALMGAKGEDGMEEEDEMLMDVIAEEMYIAELDDDPDRDEGFTHFPFTEARARSHSVCLNQTGLGLLIALGVAGGLVIVALATMLLLGRAREAKLSSPASPASSETGTWRSGASTASSASPLGPSRLRKLIPAPFNRSVKT